MSKFICSLGDGFLCWVNSALCVGPRVVQV